MFAPALALCACGGASGPGPALAAGTTYSLDYQLTGNPGGTLSQVSSVQASPATGPSDVVVTTTTNAAFSPPVPGTIVMLPDRKRYVQVLEGTDTVTKDVFELAPNWPSELESPFNPFLRDRRYGLAPGTSFDFVRNYANSSSPLSTTITYVGQESVTVPAGTYTGCKFEERAGDGSVTTTWVAKGAGVMLKLVGATQTQELLGTSRLNGLPI